MSSKSKIEKILAIARKLNEDDFREHTITSGNSADDVLEELDFYLKKHLSDKKRKAKIIEHISNISAGDFSGVLAISKDEDELDVISMGLNIFVEELRENAISIKAFDDVFNSFKSPFFIVNTKSKVITKFNKSTLDFFNYTRANKYLIPITDILDVDLIKMIKSLKWNNATNNIQQTLTTTRNQRWVINFSKLDSTYNPVSSVAVLITDVTHEFEKQKETENLVFRTIVDTQEKERLRFAKDIHDSLGQQLSGINFHLASIIGDRAISTKMGNALLLKSREALQEVLKDVRNICFNLMPKTLEIYGLVAAIRELCKKIEFSGLLEFTINTDNDFPELNKSLEIALFRIIQEFINNAIKHGKATKISIALKNNLHTISLSLKDNGVGFDDKRTNPLAGMGLKNVKSRVDSYNGEVKIKSTLNKGTKYDITIPINKNTLVS